MNEVGVDCANLYKVTSVQWSMFRSHHRILLLVMSIWTLDFISLLFSLLPVFIASWQIDLGIAKYIRIYLFVFYILYMVTYDRWLVLNDWFSITQVYKIWACDCYRNTDSHFRSNFLCKNRIRVQNCSITSGFHAYYSMHRNVIKEIKEKIWIVRGWSFSCFQWGKLVGR